MGILIFAGVVIALVLAIFVVDLLNGSHQRRRLNGGHGRSDVDDFRVRDDRIQNSNYASFSARSVRNRRQGS